ncbi:hypothetical protein OPQ81_008044 [Rhizoctonia solani]|nr:hypothetical protein OPQ81_008044 [Rhizoctonia solani]
MILAPQTTYFADFLDTILPTFPDTRVDGNTLADTPIVPLEENKFSQHLSDDRIEADKVLLNMLMDNVPKSIIRSILHSDSYDILVPPNSSITPYIVISYADDTEEEQYVFFTDRDKEEHDEERCPDPEAESLELPSYTALEFDEMEGLESPSDLEDYFAGCDRYYHNASNLNTPPDMGLLDLTTDTSDSLCTTQFLPFNSKTGIENWPVDFTKRDDKQLDIIQGLGPSLELYSENTGSDLIQYGNHQSLSWEF